MGYDSAPQEAQPVSNLWHAVARAMNSMGTDSGKPKSSKADDISFVQWACQPNNGYFACSPTIENLPPGTYTIYNTNQGPKFQQMDFDTDSLIVLEDTPSKYVVDSIRKFWSKKEQYDKYALLYKRGIILSGPPGSGKTAAVSILSKELVKAGGIVIYVSDPNVCAEGLKQLRMIERDRPLICIFEDIDEMIDHYGEHGLLALLDGEYQIANVTNLATSNYPDKLAARIINRPSRFDEHVKIDMPNEGSRRQYLKHITRNHPVDEQVLEKWVRDTDRMSIAHLKEMVVAVNCLDQPYESVLQRLKSMFVKPKPYNDFKLKDGFGFRDE